ncbi:MAG TPA: hypothetical protein VNZ45_04220 [Bacteroidia bacterium]|nr:hypothetical protein [Bacteroidia bacterium]
MIENLIRRSDILKKFTHTEASMLQNIEGKKLYDCNDAELKQMLAYCCLMVGIERPPGDDKKAVIISFLRKYYGTLTNRQVAQAFELVANGELGHNIQEHYNNVSPLYISNVLRAYLQKFNGIKNRYEVKRKQEEAPKSTPEAYYNRLIKVVEGYNVIPMFWAWEEVHEYLSKSIGGAFARALSPEEKKEAVIKFVQEKYPNAIIQELRMNNEE